MKVLTLYFLNGCPACEGNEKAWKEACKMIKGKMKTKRTESSEMPMGVQVVSFPTMKIEDESGHEVKRIEGRRSSGKEILKDLGISSRTRSHTLRRRGGVKSRKLRHRTLRNYVALR